MTNHFLAHRPNQGMPHCKPGTEIHWSKNPSGDLCVFLHGFGGDAITTWKDFPNLLRENPAFARTDLIFWGYDSLLTPISNSGSNFYSFLSHFIEQGTKILPYAFRKRTGQNQHVYRKITIIAHSLGALVAHLALLDAVKEESKWRFLVDLVLFAPAHNGSKVGVQLTTVTEDIAKQIAAVKPFVSSFIEAVNYFIVTADDLRPDSTLIASIRTRTDEAIKCGNLNKSKAVFWAQYERIVKNENYPGNPHEIQLNGTDHFSVCKPKTHACEQMVHLQRILAAV